MPAHRTSHKDRIRTPKKPTQRRTIRLPFEDELDITFLHNMLRQEAFQEGPIVDPFELFKDTEIIIPTISTSRRGKPKPSNDIDAITCRMAKMTTSPVHEETFTHLNVPRSLSSKSIPPFTSLSFEVFVEGVAAPPTAPIAHYH